MPPAACSRTWCGACRNARCGSDPGRCVSWMHELREHGAMVGRPVVEHVRASNLPAGIDEDVVEALFHYPVRRRLRIARELQHVAIEESLHLLGLRRRVEIADEDER